MTYWALFWIELYFSWLLIEYIAGRYDMIKNNKMEIMGVIGLSLFGIFIACASPDDPNTAIEDAKAEYRLMMIARNDSAAKAWKKYFDEQTKTEMVSSPTMREILLEHEVDSTKIIAIKYPDDAFTDFEEAFMVAREELGPDKVFFWLNKGYTTNYKTE